MVGKTWIKLHFQLFVNQENGILLFKNKIWPKFSNSHSCQIFPPFEVLASFCVVALEIRFSVVKLIRHPMMARDDHSTDSSNEAFSGVLCNFSLLLGPWIKVLHGCNRFTSLLLSRDWFFYQYVVTLSCSAYEKKPNILSTCILKSSIIYALSLTRRVYAGDVLLTHITLFVPCIVLKFTNKFFSHESF